MHGKLVNTYIVWILVACGVARGDEPVPVSPEEGLRIIQNVGFYTPDFDAEAFDNLWTVWPDDLKSRAAGLSPVERRRMTLELYGLPPRDTPDGRLPEPLGFVVGANGWPMNCLACHGGEVDGRVVPGLGNSRYDLQSLYEDLSAVKRRLGKPATSMDFSVGRLMFSSSAGNTAAVNFGVVLGALRDEHLDRVLLARPPKLFDYGMAAPPLWNVKYKERQYCDDFAPKTHRMLMQFILHSGNSGDYIRGQEDRFRNIAAWIESLEPPQNPHPIDVALAERGRAVFNRTCAECHGRYEAGRVEYPERVIAIDEIRTDPVRWRELNPAERGKMVDNWITRYGADPVVVDSPGYVAPPLVGVWASAPYFHNGSAPTLWHVLHPEDRPAFWKPVGKEYDRERVGLKIDAYDQLPAEYKTWNKHEQRRVFRTDQPGHSAAGHVYPSVLNEEERRAVLEYMKSL